MLRAAVAIACGLCLFSSLAIANAPPPEPRPQPAPAPRPVPRPVAPEIKFNAPVKIEYADLAADGKDVKAKIAIPRSLLTKMSGRVRGPRETLRPTEAAPEKSATPSERQSNLPPMNTIIAGLALSGGAIGLVFVARGNRTARMIAVTIIAGSALAGGYALADLRVPDEPREREVEIKGDQVVVQMTAEGDSIVITLPKK